jgi:hypothetical protein
VKRKIIKISSNGSLNFSYFLSSKQVLVNEKDNKNIFFNKTKKNHAHLKEFLSYKKKYLV